MDINGSISRLVIGGLVATGLIAGCGGSGDINISPVTTDSSTDNSVNNSNNVAAPVANPCASNGEIQGDFEAPHCMYSTAFADSGNNITVDMTLVDLDDDANAAGGAELAGALLAVGDGELDDLLLLGDGGRILAIGGIHHFRAREDARQRIVVLGRDRIELVIMATGTGHGEAQKPPGHRIHPIFPLIRLHIETPSIIVLGPEP